jgi:sialate O-acetylesterase
LLVSSLIGTAQDAALKLPAIFSDHMVLQRDVSCEVWGWDAPGTTVSVELGSAAARGTADAEGRWSVRLPSFQAGGPHTFKVRGSSELAFQDVWFGDVWFCSGQSNMEWNVAQSGDAEKEIAEGDRPAIRHIKISHTTAAEPQSDVPASGWKVASPATVGEFTAVGYYFAKHLQPEIGVPIGLIGCNWGGSRIEPWTPPEGFRMVPALADIANNLQQFPSKNDKGEIDWQSPLAIYNGMVFPLLKYRLKGALWYQGEANVGEGMLYHDKMKALIGGWRKVWNIPDLPFYFVQLAPFRYGDPQGLPELWEAQRATLSVPETGMVVTTDIGDVADIHPSNKQEVGRRLALWALVETYAKYQFVNSGPLFRDARVEGSQIRVQFDYIDGGLTTRDGQPPTGFELAGSDGNFAAADARIEGDSVVLQAKDVSAPTQVRFAWSQEANPNLMNKSGLPAVPFRKSQ